MFTSRGVSQTVSVGRGERERDWSGVEGEGVVSVREGRVGCRWGGEGEKRVSGRGKGWGGDGRGWGGRGEGKGVRKEREREREREREPRLRENIVWKELCRMNKNCSKRCVWCVRVCVNRCAHRCDARQLRIMNIVDFRSFSDH